LLLSKKEVRYSYAKAKAFVIHKNLLLSKKEVRYSYAKAKAFVIHKNFFFQRKKLGTLMQKQRLL
ncbi:hypothetical protein ACLIJU_08830, partial [Staphylococcus warneri]